MASDLRVSPPTVHDWLKGTKRPRASFRAALEEWTRGEVPASSWDTSERGDDAPARPLRALAAPARSRSRSPRHRATPPSTEAELLAAMAPQVTAAAADQRCRVCGCFDAAPTCSDLLAALIDAVPRGRAGRDEEDLVVRVARDFEEDLGGAAELHTKRALVDLLRCGLAERRGGRVVLVCGARGDMITLAGVGLTPVCGLQPRHKGQHACRLDSAAGSAVHRWPKGSKSASSGRASLRRARAEVPAGLEAGEPAPARRPRASGRGSRPLSKAGPRGRGRGARTVEATPLTGTGAAR